MSFRTTAVTPLLLVLLAATFVVLAVLVAGGASDGFDASVIALVRSAALELPLAPLRHVTELGSTWAVTIVAVVTLLLGVVLRRPRTGAAGAVTIALASLVNGFAKIAVARARPDLLEPIVEDTDSASRPATPRSAWWPTGWSPSSSLVPRCRSAGAGRSAPGWVSSSSWSGCHGYGSASITRPTSSPAGPRVEWSSWPSRPSAARG